MRLLRDDLFIKISGVTTEEDALFSIGLGASAISFDFLPSAWQVSPTHAHEIVRRLPSGAISVGVFRNELPERVVEIANTIGLTMVQIDGPCSQSQLQYIGERVNSIIRSVPSDFDYASGVPIPEADYLLMPDVDDYENLVDCLEVFGDEALRTPIIVGGGLSDLNVADVVQNYPVWGVDVRSGVESTPGVKDPARLGAFIGNAKWAFDNSLVLRRNEEWFNF
jgi:phosphoribosylanthranilate isomerase